MNGERLAEGYFTTRKKRGDAVRFVAFGDNSFGDISDRMIAYQTYQARPDFVMNTGDNVYENGLDDEYARHFFPVYNADVAGPRVGAPLLRSVPFYTVMANHDVHQKGPRRRSRRQLRRQPRFPCLLHVDAPASERPGSADLPDTRSRRSGARGRIPESGGRARFPRMANYSFDYGDGHFSLPGCQRLHRSHRSRATGVDRRRPDTGRRRALEVRYLSPSGIQCRGRALRGAAHARALAAIRKARRRPGPERPRARLPAHPPVYVRPQQSSGGEGR